MEEMMRFCSTASKLGLTAGMVIAALLVGRATASATPITFDFESLSTSSGTSTVTQTVGGVTVTVDRQDSAALTVQDLGGSPPAFGSRTIGNFIGGFTAPGSTLVVSFSSAVSSAGISFGDFGGDDDSPVVLNAFSGTNGTGTNLGSVSISYPLANDLDNGNSAIGTLGLSAVGIQSFTVASGGPFPGSLYFDNVTVDTSAAASVPEPASMLLVGTGVAALVARRRARRS
jgi:hypothetical protein